MSQAPRGTQMAAQVAAPARPAAAGRSVAASSVGRRRTGTLAGIAQGAAILLLIGFLLLPVYWMVATSLKTTNQTFAIPPVFLFQPSLEHYREVFRLQWIEGQIVHTALPE